MIDIKTCSRCSTLKKLEEFYNDSRHLDNKMPQCKECHKAFTTSWRNNHPAQTKAIQARGRKNNPGKSRFDRAMRHAAKQQATPIWLSKQHIESIKQFYVDCPEGYEIDHIVPLRAKNVKGLHVIWNLQYLPKSENRRKSNKLMG